MKMVLDASVAVAAMRAAETEHAAARAQVERALQGVDVLIQPALFAIEVAGALARQGRREADIRALLEPLGAPPHRIVTLGPKSAASARACAVQGRLRGADAVYVGLASSRGLPLCTLDGEIVRRGAAFCRVVFPHQTSQIRI